MFFPPKKGPILVTGAGGFVGQALCRRLQEDGITVFAVDAEQAGVCRPERLAEFADRQVSHVFHLAGKTLVSESWKDPSLYFAVNTMGTQYVLEFCRGASCSLTYVSSYLYGVPQRLPTDETATIKLTSPYATSKYLAEELCRYYAAEFSVPCVILRPFNLFGPMQKSCMLIPQIVDQVLGGREIQVQDLTPRRDYLYIDDMIDALLVSRPSEGAGLGIYNLGSGRSFSVEEIIALVQKAAGTDLPVRVTSNTRRNEIPETRADSGLISRTFGWRPKISMEEGVRRVVEDARLRYTQTPINKGNYSLEPSDREARFEELRGAGWQDEYRAYRRDWTDLPRQRKVRDYPLQVDLELSSTCNLSCPMCFTQTDSFVSDVPRCFMDNQLFRKIIDEIAGHVPAVRLSLRGESTLHPLFVDNIRYAKSRGIGEVSFLTNGSTMTPGFFEQIMDAGADWITFSIDGVGDVYEQIRRPLKFEQTLENIRSICRIKQRHGRVRPVIKVQTLWPAIRNNPEIYYDTFAPITDLVAFNPLIDYLGRDQDIVFEDDFVCPQLYQRVLIGADGTALLCSNDEMCRESPGDARVQSIREIWHGKTLQRIRALHLQPRGFMQIPLCRHCYLPRKTEDSETTQVHGRIVHIQNYVNRSQEIGT